jgi:hypothetical protein
VGGSGIASITITIDTSQWDVLDATPLTVVPAVSGKILVPVAWAQSTVKNAGAWAVSTVALRLRYNGDTSTIINSLDTGLGLAAAGTIPGSEMALTIGPFTPGGFDPVNKALMVDTGTSVSTGGTRTAATTLTLWYYQFTP